MKTFKGEKLYFAYFEGLTFFLSKVNSRKQQIYFERMLIKE